MPAETLKVLDFHNPRRPSSVAWRQLSNWHSQLCPQVQEAWAALLAHPVTLLPGQVEPMQSQTALSSLPEEALGVYLTIGEEHLPSMLVFTARQIQGLLADLLDLSADTWPEPRKLTTVEEAMLELLFQSFAEGIGSSWPGTERLKCRYLEITSKPQRTRIFPVGAAFFVSRIQIQSRFGEEECYWLMLKEETEQLVLDQLEETPQEESGRHEISPILAERIPLDVVIELGTAELSMSQMAALSVGDVLVLDQFVSRPLAARVEGQVKWHGVPMRIGSRQAFEISQLPNPNQPRE